MYEAGVTPVYDYGASIWGFNKSNNHADLVQNRAMRYFLGVNRFTAIPALAGEMGWYPTKYSKYICMLQLWNRLIKMSDDRLPKRLFYIDYERATARNCNNWCNNVREVFSLLDEQDIYCGKKVCNIGHCWNKFMSIAQEEWKSNVLAKPKLRTYNIFKNNLCTSDYVEKITSRYDRSMLAKFRCGVLQLHIETGRYTNKKVEERVCYMCDKRETEDEYHFLCKCPYYADERKVLYDNISTRNEMFMTMSDEDKFTYLMSECSINVCKYIKVAWEKRRNKLYQ